MSLEYSSMEWSGLASEYPAGLRPSLSVRKLVTRDEIDRCAQDFGFSPAESASVHSALQARLSTLKSKPRFNSTRLLDLSVSASPEWFAVSTADRVEGYFRAAVEWFSNRHGAANVVSVSRGVHDALPSVRMLVVPITPMGKLHGTYWCDTTGEAFRDFGFEVGARFGMDVTGMYSPEFCLRAPYFKAAFEALGAAADGPTPTIETERVDALLVLLEALIAERAERPWGLWSDREGLRRSELGGQVLAMWRDGSLDPNLMARLVEGLSYATDRLALTAAYRVDGSQTEDVLASAVTAVKRLQARAKAVASRAETGSSAAAPRSAPASPAGAARAQRAAQMDALRAAARARFPLV